MSYLFRGILISNYCNNLIKVHIFTPRVVQLVCLSILSNKPSSTAQNSKKRDKKWDLNKHGEVQGFDPLFNEILGILGTENIVEYKTEAYEFLMSKEARPERSETSVHGVCGNAEEKIDEEKMKNLSGLEDGKGWVSDDIKLIDVSPIVHKVTQIVRGENGMFSMEERLENANFEYNEEVVEKVLKRCFKVPDLALRFLNWVKFRKGFQHTVNTYNTTIHLAGEAKKFELVEELVEEMEKNYCEKNVRTWTVLVSHYGKAKLIAKALSVFEKMKRSCVKPDGTAYRIMLRALCNAGKADIALEFYKEMVHNEVDMDLGLYKQLLKCFALSGDVAAVHVAGHNMITVSEIPEPRVYDSMLKSFCIAGRIREALELIHNLNNKKIALDTQMFVTLVKGLCSADRIVDALEIVEIMKKRNVFDRKIYEILISTYLKRNEVSKAFNLFQEIKDSGDVSVSTYTKLMQHLFWKNEFQKGIELYNEMIEVGIQPDCLAITAVAAGYIRQNYISEAWKFFKSMDEKGIKLTSKAYAIFINELCKVSQGHETAKVLNEMQACKVNIQDNVFKQVLCNLEKKGGIKKPESLKMMPGACVFYPGRKEKPNDKPYDLSEPIRQSESNQADHRRLNCLSESASRSCANPDVLEVSQILSSSTDWCLIQERLKKCVFQFTPDLVVESLHNCRLDGGNALKFFSWVGKQPGYSHNAQSYNMAMKIAGQGKDFKQMRNLFYEMKRRGCLVTSDTWTIMIMQYGRAGLTDIALINFRDMKLSGCKPTKSTYKSLISSLCGKKGRKVDEAIQIYEEMVQTGCIPDKELVETYLICLCEVNKLSDARSCMESLCGFGFTIPLTYSLYFRALCRTGKLEDALDLMDEVGAERNILDQFTCGSLIHGLLRRGRLEEALVKIETMRQVGIYPTVHVYTALIIHFFKEKEINRALETLEEMKRAGYHPTIVTYSALICGYVRMEQVTDAWNVFHHLKQNGPSPDFKAYSMFINCLCRIGKSEEAFKLVPEMMRDGIFPSSINFQKIIHGLNREGKPNLAQVVLKKKLDLNRRRKMHHKIS